MSASLILLFNNSINFQFLESPKACKIRPTVVLKSGLIVVGTVNQTDNNLNYYSFRGIPFAKPPIGKRRFKAPSSMSKNLTGIIIDASQDVPRCVEFILEPRDSEDCLYLNVYTPELKRHLPVIVWIHGGGFMYGGNDYYTYDPEYLIQEKIVVVTINYRLGIFGFLSTEDNESPGNYGLRDQVLALRWVRKNISRFGGNKLKITIFGESAGAASASYLSQSSIKKELFQGAIFNSGNCLTLWSLTRNPKSIAYEIGAKLGINLTSTKTLVKGLREVDYRTLAIAQIDGSAQVYTQTVYSTLILDVSIFKHAKDILKGMPFGPTVETLNSKTIVTNQSHENLRNGHFRRIPYLMGYNSEEGAFFDNVVKFIPLLLLGYKQLYKLLPPESLNIKDDTSKADAYDVIKNYYFNPIITSKKFMKYISDDMFNRPINEAALLYSQFSPVYLYEFSYFGKLGSKSKSIPGVSHTDELNYIFKRTSKKQPSSSDLLTVKRMARLWSNFAKTGNPTPTIDPLLENVTWERANKRKSHNLNYLSIDKSLVMKVNPKWDAYIFWKSLFSIYGKPPYGTY
ncbi:hypothetical protein FQR65_LT07012 [Abscondita terminalis]|nr:hypothetical protein FQR65_LT07012 [Abscondita terminalis]